jgi:ABC-type multidrug transport system fused ATPase/permease subunit
MYRYVVLLSRPVGQLQAQIQNLQQAGASITRIEELLAARSRIAVGGDARLPPGPLAVTLDGVTFAYPSLASKTGSAPTGDGAPSHPAAPAAPVAALDALSLSVAPGGVLGLAGRSGSGKSTIARLLVRAYDPTAGTVRVSGMDVRDLSLAHLRARVGLVTQEVQLFQATVRDNLTLFDPAVPDASLLGATAALGLSSWMETLPDGLDTVLGPAGAGLSAGQAQLLALVRVFLRDPGLVVLDEASSRLDPATERLLDGAIERLLLGRTAIVIAHRPETLRRASEVVVLERGRLVERPPSTGGRPAVAPHSTSDARAGAPAGGKDGPS